MLDIFLYILFCEYACRNKGSSYNATDLHFFSVITLNNFVDTKSPHSVVSIKMYKNLLRVYGSRSTRWKCTNPNPGIAVDKTEMLPKAIDLRSLLELLLAHVCYLNLSLYCLELTLRNILLVLTGSATQWGVYSHYWRFSGCEISKYSCWFHIWQEYHSTNKNIYWGEMLFGNAKSWQI